MSSPRRPAQPSPPSSGATAPTPRGRHTYRNPQRIQYEPIKFQEANWGRRLGGWAVVAVVVLGALGWYHYLTKPPARVAPTTSTVLTPGPRSTQSTSATEPASRPASQSSAQRGGPEPGLWRGGHPRALRRRPSRPPSHPTVGVFPTLPLGLSAYAVG